MTEAYIFDAVRTPRGRGRISGALHEVAPARLAATTLRELRERSNLDTRMVNDVILGCVETINEQAANVAKAAVFASGFDPSVPGIQVNRFCGSGLEACNFAAAMVKSGQAELIVAGGVESMSRVPMFSAGAPWVTDPQITIPHRIIPQGVAADLIATKWGYGRQEVDVYAAESQRRAAHAWREGYFKSIVPVRDCNGLIILERDEHMRPDTTVDSLAMLEPSFTSQGETLGFDAVALHRYPELAGVNHVHHAGNSSGIVDGASAVLIGSAAAGKAQGMKPRARIRSFGTVGSEPTIMLTGPAAAAQAALRRAGLNATDVDLYECNEAFAAVVLRFMDALDVPHSKVNVNGGAIAFGHPLGATGGMLIGTLLDELERRDQSIGVVTMCVGGGMGSVMVIERV
ncbi:acetyl-CoA C-acetyltransferase [Noviherbaspirillum sedimenti]|uniref:Acetyl-CoA C-acetyltransferase n=1 Tax=Noviherbaspirillum sedimenti TaxID=2320865 RepID=A0A3A3G2D6_9BURK|nr:acetyl-CoA C-acetyltransferase [Noviherbaspirillum sedimenti]RJG02658.1 acetyl-CoA C-acetyltransferase [Noviherbaspirillum sedimenti]